MTQEHRINLDKVIELYRSKVAFYESQNTRGEYAVTVRELKYVVETLEALRSEKPKGDLISREDLKEQFTKAAENYNHECVIGMLSALATIDNAPTVDVISNEEGYEMYGKGYLQGYERGKNERPQGEWGQCYENYKNGMFYRDCSICGKGTITGDWKFCPYCGAAMRDGIPTTDDKGAEE